jgi:hypothetical protein
MMIHLRGRAPTSSPSRIRAQLSRALAAGDRETARRIFYSRVVPDRAFSTSEVDHLADRVGAIDEGDGYLLSRTDL